ncbi:hypothetical protein J6590_058496 [Homalodisca vitripennis]|nr:hypothetical protein J6590_058496 [Homalodisca vitripennis]
MADGQHFWDVETVWCSGSGLTFCAKKSEMAVHDVAITLLGTFTAHSNPNVNKSQTLGDGVGVV